RLASEGTYVAEAEHRRAVADNGNQVRTRGQRRGLPRVVTDGKAGIGNARGGGERQVVLVGQAFGRGDRDFAGDGEAMVVQRRLAKQFLIHARSSASLVSGG